LLVLLDNTITSITDPFFSKYYKTNVNQDATNNILTLTINATNSIPAIYSITDTLGKTFAKQSNLNLEQGLNQFDIDIANLPSGNYFLQLTIAGHSQTIKFIVVR
jgi:hypothetical protein